MANNEGLIAAYMLDGKGGGQRVGWSEIRQWTASDGLLWVHLNYTAPEAQQWIKEESQLEDLVGDALLADESRPRVTAFDDGLLIALRGVNLNPGADPEDMVSLRIWAEKNRIITTRRRKLLSVADICSAIEKGKGPKTCGEFLEDVSDRLMSRMGGVIDDLEDKVAELEEAVLTKESHELRPMLASIRRNAIYLRRYMAPQREAIARLQSDKISWLTDEDKLRLREVYDRLTRYIEDLDAAREHAAVTQEELVSRLSEQMDNRMYVLTIVAAIFLPLSFLTGLLGINVGGIPGAEYKAAFAIFCMLLVAVVIIELIIFKKKKWM
ncbi:MAG: zinc transporter ZntB [Desulfobacterales bacterium]|nr:zinc transporter ZntB [Desulfobacterales bacterium]